MQDGLIRLNKYVTIYINNNAYNVKVRCYNCVSVQEEAKIKECFETLPSMQKKSILNRARIVVESVFEKFYT